MIVGVDNDGKVIRDWRISDKKIKKISINGEGKRLLVELDDGALLFYEDWEKEKGPVKIKGLLPALFCPLREIISLPAFPKREGNQRYFLPAETFCGRRKPRYRMDGRPYSRSLITKTGSFWSQRTARRC